MFVIDQIKLKDNAQRSKPTKLYVLDSKTVTYAIDSSAPHAEDCFLEVLFYVSGQYVGTKVYVCPNPESHKFQKQKVDDFSLSLQEPEATNGLLVFP